MTENKDDLIHLDNNKPKLRNTYGAVKFLKTLIKHKEISISYTDMAEPLKFSDGRCVRNMIKRLESTGLVNIERNPPGINIYKLTNDAETLQKYDYLFTK